MSFDLQAFIATPSQELLNLAKKSDLLDIAAHYELTDVNKSMLKQEIKNVLVQFLVDKEILDSSALSLVLVTQTGLQMRELEIQRQIELEKLRLEQEKLKMEMEERVKEQERQMQKERMEMEEREKEKERQIQIEREKLKFDTEEKERERQFNFIWASLYTFTGNYSILDYFTILFILDLNSEFRNIKLWDQKLIFKGFVL